MSLKEGEMVGLWLVLDDAGTDRWGTGVWTYRKPCKELGRC